MSTKLETGIPLIDDNMGLVIKITEGYASHFPQYRDDFRSEAMVQLVTKIGQYDPERGKIATFIGTLVRNSCNTFLRNNVRKHVDTVPLFTWFNASEEDDWYTWDELVPLEFQTLHDYTECSVEEVIRRLEDVDKLIVRWLMMGRSLVDIAAAIQESKQFVHYRVSKLQRKFYETNVLDARQYIGPKGPWCPEWRAERAVANVGEAEWDAMLLGRRDVNGRSDCPVGSQESETPMHGTVDSIRQPHLRSGILH